MILGPKLKNTGKAAVCDDNVFINLRYAIYIVQHTAQDSTAAYLK